jgi:hypothetical protein
MPKNLFFDPIFKPANSSDVHAAARKIQRHSSPDFSKFDEFSHWVGFWEKIAESK